MRSCYAFQFFANISHWDFYIKTWRVHYLLLGSHAISTPHFSYYCLRGAGNYQNLHWRQIGQGLQKYWQQPYRSFYALYQIMTYVVMQRTHSWRKADSQAFFLLRTLSYSFSSILLRITCICFCYFRFIYLTISGSIISNLAQSKSAGLPVVLQSISSSINFAIARFISLFFHNFHLHAF